MICLPSSRMLAIVFGLLVTQGAGAASAAPSARKPVPDAPAQRDANRLVKDLYAPKLQKAQSPAERALLAKEILAVAVQTRDDPNAGHALYILARDLAVQAGDVQTALAATDAVSERYEVDALRSRVDVLARLLEPQRQELDCKRVAVDLSRAMQTALAEDRYDIARTAAMHYANAARRSGDAELSRDAANGTTFVRQAEDTAHRASEARKLLANEPENASAKLAVGRYLCFAKGDWKQGLPLLAASADAELQKAAKMDLQGATDVAATVRLADTWWDAGEQALGLERRGAQLRAAAHYQQALPTLSGIAKAKAERRIEQVQPPAPLRVEVAQRDQVEARQRIVDLLPLVDVKSDAVTGAWTVTDGVLRSDMRHYTLLQLPYRPPAEYNFEIVFVRDQGNGDVTQVLRAGDKRFTWVMGAWGNKTAGFEGINGALSITNPASVRRDSILANGRKYTSTIKVRKDRVQGFVDGELLVDWKTDYSEMSSNRPMPDPLTIGVGSAAGATSFYSIKVTEITGTGELLRGTSSAEPLPEKIILGKWKYYFKSSRALDFEFMPDGTIAGGNDNESRWRVVIGKLEVLKADGTVGRRFAWNAADKRWTAVVTPDVQWQNADAYITKESAIDLTAVKPSASKVPGWSRLGINGDPFDGYVPEANGQRVQRYFAAHAPSHITFSAEQYGGRSFKASGLLFGSSSTGVIFVVTADGKEIHRSPVAKYKVPMPIEVVIPQGCRELSLIVDPHGHNGGDWSYWLNPRIVEDPSLAPVVAKPESAVASDL